MDNLNLTPMEEQALKSSYRPEVTKKRRILILLTSCAFVVAIITVFYTTRSSAGLLFICMVYVVITTIEKIAHASGILVYKSLIRKLKSQSQKNH